MTAFWGVVVGGILTILAQVVAESIKSRQQSRARESERETSARQFHRQAADQAGAATAELQLVYVDYEAASVPDAALERALRVRFAAFERAVAQVASPSLRARLREWQGVCEQWVNGNATQAAETAAFHTAMSACGEGTLKYL